MLWLESINHFCEYRSFGIYAHCELRCFHFDLLLFRDMMLVNIYKKPSTIAAPRSSLNPFAEEFQMSPKNGAQSVGIHEMNSAANEFPEPHTDEQVNAVDPPPASNAVMDCANGNSINEYIPKAVSNGAQFTKRELEELFEEPLNTSNALVAVTGYAPKDDARLCRFFNPKTGKCFKGNSCRFEHAQIMKGM